MQTPPNPHNFPDPNELNPREIAPIPPVEAVAVPQSVAKPSRGPVISFDAISDAWNLFTAGAATWVGATAIYLVISTALTFWLMFTLPDPASGRGFNPMFWLPLLLLAFILTFFHGGMFRMALGQIRTGEVRFADLWSALDVLPTLLVVSFLEGLAIGFGSCLCLVPGLLALGLLMFAIPLVVDPQKRMGAMASLSTSYAALKPQMWMAVAFALVCYLLANAGQAACGIGVVVSLPIFYLAVAVAYRDFFFSDPGNISTPAAWQPPPPIADPRG